MNSGGNKDPSDLIEKRCVPRDVGAKPFDLDTIQNLLPAVPKWKLEGEKRISRSFRFINFVEAMRFIKAVADLPNAEAHHPDMFISYNYVKITLMTHNITGLSENGFIMTSKINEN